MSGCTCDDPRSFRVTGEVWHGVEPTVGSGERAVRVRCRRCGGKVGTVGSDLLELLGVDESEIRNGRVLPESQRPTLEVDLC